MLKPSVLGKYFSCCKCIWWCGGGGVLILSVVLSSPAVWCKASGREWLLSPVCQPVSPCLSWTNNKYQYSQSPALSEPEWGEDPIVKCKSMWLCLTRETGLTCLHIFRSHSHLHNHQIRAKYTENIQESPGLICQYIWARWQPQHTHGLVWCGVMWSSLDSN